MGGEPTFVSIDDRDGAEWNTAALGPTKRLLAPSLMRQAAPAATATGGLLHFGQGKWYPGEQLPRWSLNLLLAQGRRAGLDARPTLFADETKDYGVTEVEARQFLEGVARRLGLDPTGTKVERKLVPRNLLLVSGVLFLGICMSSCARQSRSDSVTQPRTFSKQVPGDTPRCPCSKCRKCSSSQYTENSAHPKSQHKLRMIQSHHIVPLKLRERVKNSLVLGGKNRPATGKIPPGSFVKATLLTGASNGPVRAEVSGLTLNGETLIEEGTTLLSNGQSNEDPLTIQFSNGFSRRYIQP